MHEMQRIIAHSSSINDARWLYCVYASWALLPVILLYPLFNQRIDTSALLSVAIAGAMALSIVISHSLGWSRAQRYLRIPATITAAACVVFFTWLGYDAGASALWTYVYPLIAMFLLGLGPGMLATTGTLAACVAVMVAGPEIGSYAYSEAFIRRFTLSVSLVAMLAFTYEYWRVRLEFAKQDIDAELAQTKRQLDLLSDLARVCAWCQKVKSVDGQWLTMEDYLRRTESVGITHSVCEDCAQSSIQRAERQHTD